MDSFIDHTCQLWCKIVLKSISGLYRKYHSSQSYDINSNSNCILSVHLSEIYVIEVDSCSKLPHALFQRNNYHVAEHTHIPRSLCFQKDPPNQPSHSREYLTNYETCVSTESFIPSSWPALSHERAGILVLCKLSFENDDNYDDDDMI